MSPRSSRIATGMEVFDAWQSRFAAALHDAAAPVPAHWIGPDGAPSMRRFGIYRNNVVAGLALTLGDAYPVVYTLVGDTFFQAMACSYVREHLPHSPILHEYGDGYAAFIERYPPAAGLPYLGGVARIERAWVEAYHAREAEPLPAQRWLSAAAADVERLRFTLHPTLRIVRSELPIRTIWQMHRGEVPMSAVPLAGDPQDTLLLRPHASVDMHALQPGEADFIQALCHGETVCAAYDHAIRRASTFELAATFARLASWGAVVALSST